MKNQIKEEARDDTYRETTRTDQGVFGRIATRGVWAAGLSSLGNEVYRHRKSNGGSRRRHRLRDAFAKLAGAGRGRWPSRWQMWRMWRTDSPGGDCQATPRSQTRRGRLARILRTLQA